MQHHRNILYALVFIALVLQLVSFVSLSSRASQLGSELALTRTQLQQAVKQLNDTLVAYDIQQQRSTNEISLALNDLSTKVSQQQSSVEQELLKLKSGQGDFSGIVVKAVKSVVTIRTDRSIGTGFIIAPDGYVVTNFHVISGARRLGVVTYDKELVAAKLIGIDRFHDLALLKIEGSYDALSLGDSDKLQVGNKVIAIGNPLGLSFTVTEGIISALERIGPNNEPDYIQTDVSLNPGNSGGPLIDIQGNAIGINNFKVGDAESLGFALESNVLKEAVRVMSNSTLVLA